MIDVAIMGAGLSGLSCAITLEKHGINPTIFEKRSRIGDRFVNCEIILNVLNKPINDFIAYLSQHYGIYLKPTSNIKKLVLHSEHEKAEINGHLGFTNLRGRDADSFENQLASQVKSKIHFNSDYSYERLQQDFTHVVMATGDAAYAEKVQDYRRELTVTLKGAIVVGQFDRYTVRGWLDNRLAPKGYGYLIPISEKEANIVIGIPDYPENLKKDINILWDRFYNRVCQLLEQQVKITDQFEVNGYIIGISRYPRIGNTFFTGNCFGSIMPFLGFGQTVAILTGIYAALDICGKDKYEVLTDSLQNSFENSLALRQGMEKLNNSRFDFLIKKMDGFIGQKLFNSNYDFLKLVSYLLRALIKK